MKTYRTLYPEICAFDRLYFAWRKARRNKRYTLAAPYEQHLLRYFVSTGVEGCIRAPVIPAPTSGQIQKSVVGTGSREAND